MTKPPLIRTYLLWLSPLLVVTVSGLAVWSVYLEQSKRLQTDHLARELKLYQEVRQCIVQNYVSSVEAEKLMLGALEGLTSSLDDHSTFQDPESYADFRKAMEGVIPGGVGVRIRPGAEGVMIMTPLWGSPALAAGLQPGDLIIAIDGHPAAGLEVAQVSALLGGEVDTTVHLKIKREAPPHLLEVAIVRKDIELASVAQIGFADADAGIAYLRLSSFQEDSGNEVRDAIARLQGLGLRSLIFDLRSNLGGRLSAACEIADLFLSGGMIVVTEGRGDNVRASRFAKSAGTLPDFPLVLLVDGESASASEVLAGALQDQQRAFIVGTRTWGKGSVQEVFPLDDDTMALKLTTKRYLTPNGRSLHREPDARVWGIVPNTVIELTDQERSAVSAAWVAAEVLSSPTDERPLVAPNHDRHLDAAVAILTGKQVYSDSVTFK